LIVCWSFPPASGIGGRRWAKFAKYLHNEGYNISVLKSDDVSGQNEWNNDIKNCNITYHILSQNIWIKFFNSKNKLISRLSSLLIKILCKGTIYDKTVLLKKTVIKKVRDIIMKEKTGVIIVTGAPFNLMYYVACALENNYNIVKIADYRDPWITAMNYGMPSLSKERKKYEEMKQNKVLDTFDRILAPNDFLLEEIKDAYTGTKENSQKFITLPHAFDKDDYTDNFTVSNSNLNEINIVYGGAIYIGLEGYLEKLSNAIMAINKKGIKINCTLYTPDANRWKKCYYGLDFEEPIGKKFYNKIANADLLLMLYAEHNKNYLTTKFYEYLPLRKPMLYLGPKGYISKLIQEKNLGFVLTESELDLLGIVSQLKKNLNNEIVVDINEFSYKTRTQELIALINYKNNDYALSK
jgi:hypothetical protein